MLDADWYVSSFCAMHRHACSHESQETFRLHRDIIHTLLLPMFLLHSQASRIASSVLPSQRAAEPERAFRGDARSAYSWLHCVLSEEHDWYLMEPEERSAILAEHAELVAKLPEGLFRSIVSGFDVTFEMADPKHMGHLLNQVRGVEGVFDAYRMTSNS